MAGITWSGTPGAVALTASTAKTVLQITAPTNQRLLVRRISFFFNGTDTAAARVIVRVLKQTTAGTATSLTLVKLDTTWDETIQGTASYNATAEPTASTVKLYRALDPTRESIFSFGAGELLVPGGERLGIECTSGSSISVYPEIIVEE